MLVSSRQQRLPRNACAVQSKLSAACGLAAPGICCIPGIHRVGRVGPRGRVRGGAAGGWRPALVARTSLRCGPGWPGARAGTGGSARPRGGGMTAAVRVVLVAEYLAFGAVATLIALPGGMAALGIELRWLGMSCSSGARFEDRTHAQGQGLEGAGDDQRVEGRRGRAGARQPQHPQLGRGLSQLA